MDVWKKVETLKKMGGEEDQLVGSRNDREDFWRMFWLQTFSTTTFPIKTIKSGQQKKQQLTFYLLKLQK